MLTVDPSQKKAVWLLMAILIGAICVIAVRITPHDQQAVPQALRTADDGKSTPGSMEVEVRNVSRNPFMAPAAYSSAQMGANAAEMGSPAPGSVPPAKAGLDKLGKLPAIPPIVVKMPNSAQSTSNQGGTAAAANRPAFTLMATIQSSGGWSAVIRCNDSLVRVVNVGDILEAGYKVRSLKPGKAVLSNGEETIVVSKPQS